MTARTKLLAGLITALALVALSLTTYLTWSSWQSEAIAGCNADGVVDCDLVLSSHWSRWLGVPVSLSGVIIYVGVLSLCWPAAKKPWSLAGTGLLFLSLSAAGAAVWFTSVQAFLLQSFCLYCLGVHTCGLLIAGLTLLLIQGRGAEEVDYGQLQALLGVSNSSETAQQENRLVSPSRFYPVVATVAAALGLALLMGGQVLFAPDSLVIESFAGEAAYEGEQEEAEDLAFEPVSSDDELVADHIGEDQTALSDASTGPLSRRFRFKGFQKPVSVSDFPLLGNPDASHIYLELLDYTCGHCRHLHPYIHATLDQYGAQVAILIHHVPLHARCNPNVLVNRPEKKNACDYSRLAIGVWKLAPEKFPEFHNWLMEGENPPSIVKARKRALSLVGQAILIDDALNADIGRRISSQCAVLRNLKSGLPILLTERGMIRGVPKNSEEWSKFLNSQLGPPAGE